MVISISMAQLDSVNSMISTGQTPQINQSESFQNIRVISKEEIQQFNFETVNEVLQYSLNNFSIYLGREGYAMNYVGTGRKDVRVMLNGLPLIQTSIDNYDLAKITIYSIERIELSMGSTSVFYGSNAVLGTINIITEHPDKKVSSFRTNINTTSRGNINSFVSGHINISRHSFGGSIGHNFFSGVEGTDSLRVFQWKPQIRTQSELHYSYRLLNDLKAFFSLNYLTSRVQDRGYPVFNTLRAYDVDQRVKQTVIHGGVAGKISKYHTIDFSHAYSSYSLTNDKTIKILSDLTVIEDKETDAFDKLKYDEYYNHLKISKLSKKHRLNYDAGIEFSHQRDRERSILEAVKTNITQLSFLGSITYKAADNLRLKGGLRYTNSNKFETKPLYELGLKYKMSETAELISNLTRGYRTPTFNEMFYTFENPELNIVGNLNLQSEMFNQFNTTLRIKSKHVLFYTNLYWVNSNNGIQLSLIDDDKQLYQFINVKSSKLMGQNFNVIHQGKALRLEFSVSNNGINQYPKEIGNYYFAQELLFKSIYTFKSINTSLGIVSKYQGGRTETRENAFRELEEFAQQGFWLVDISVRKQLFDKPIFAHVGLKNMTNTLNVDGSYLALDRISDENINSRVPISIDFGRRIWFSLITEF